MGGNLIFGVQVNTSGAKQALNSFSKEIEQVSKGFSSGFNTALSKSPIGGFIESLKQAASSSEGLGKSLGTGAVLGLQAAAVAAAAAATAVSAFTLATAASANQIKQMSDATGVSTETISKFATMVSKGGGSVADAADIMKDYADKLGDARKGNADLSETFKKLGVDITKNNSVAFAQTIEGLGKLQDKSVAMNIGMQLFSDNYTKIASQIANGNTIINQTPIMSEEFIGKSEILMGSLNSLKTNLITLGTEAVLPIIKDLQSLTNIIMKPDLNGVTPLEKAVKAISYALKGASEIAGIITAGDRQESFVKDNKSLSEAVLLMQRYTALMGTAGTIDEKYAKSDRASAAIKSAEDFREKVKKLNDEAFKVTGMIFSWDGKSASLGDHKLATLKEMQKVTFEDYSTKKKAEEELASLNKKAAEDKVVADGKAAEALAARVKTESELAAAKAKAAAEYQAAVTKALSIVDAAENASLSSTHEGRLKLIEKEFNKQLEGIKILGEESAKYISAKKDLEEEAARKKAAEDKRYDDEAKARDAEAYAAAKAMADKLNNVLESRSDRAMADLKKRLELSEKVFGKKGGYGDAASKASMGKKEVLAEINAELTKSRDRLSEIMEVTNIKSNTVSIIAESINLDGNMKVKGGTKAEEGPQTMKVYGDTQGQILTGASKAHISYANVNEFRGVDDASAHRPGFGSKSMPSVPKLTTEGAGGSAVLANMKEETNSYISFLEAAKEAQQKSLDEFQANIAKGGFAAWSALKEADALPTTIWGRIFNVTDEDEENLNRGIEMMGYSLTTALNMFTAISDAKFAKEMKSAEDSKKFAQNELSGRKLSDRAMLAEQKKIDEKFEDSKREAFNKTKGLKIAQVGMDAASSIMGAWSGAMQLPFPASVITGGILTGMLGVTAGIQANNIRKQEYADGGVIGGFNGASMGKDNRVATVRDGEMIFNARQQRNLFKMVDKGESIGAGVSINIEKFSGGDDELSKLEDMLYNLQARGRFKFA